MNSHNKELISILRLLTESKDYIRMSELKKDFTYLISARHAWFGIWRPEHESFLISRFKFDNYLFQEYHWDRQGPYGTVKPTMEVEKSPFELSNILKTNVNHDFLDPETEQPLLEYLNGLEQEILNPSSNIFKNLKELSMSKPASSQFTS